MMSFGTTMRAIQLGFRDLSPLGYVRVRPWSAGQWQIQFLPYGCDLIGELEASFSFVEWWAFNGHTDRLLKEAVMPNLPQQPAKELLTFIVDGKGKTI